MKRLVLMLSCVLFCLPSIAQSFYSPKSYPLSVMPDKIKLVDLNHDGYADVIGINQERGVLQIAINNGDGSYHNGVTVGISNGVNDVAVGEFSGDGKVDIAVANSAAATVTVVLGNGDGTFQSPKTYSVDGTPNSITVNDFNGDGRRDIATLSSYTEKVTILSNTGSSFTKSSFAVPQYFPSQYGGGFTDYAYSLTSGDFNGDRRADLAFVDGCGTADCIVAQDVYYVLLNTTTGWKAVQADSGSGTIALTAADVDNDGRSDLLNSYYGCYHEPCTGVDVIYSNSNGTFQRVAVTSGGGIGGDPTGAAIIGDFNNDGLMDVAVPVMGGNDPVTNATIPDGFGVFTGKGGRAFSPGKYFAGTQGNIDAAFVNYDTKKDIVQTDRSNSSILVFKNSFSSTNDPCKYSAPGRAAFLRTRGLEHRVRFKRQIHRVIAALVATGRASGTLARQQKGISDHR